MSDPFDEALRVYYAMGDANKARRDALLYHAQRIPIRAVDDIEKNRRVLPQPVETQVTKLSISG